MSFQDYQGQGPYQPRPTSGKANAALILGVCGLVVCPLICSILAVVFGYQARGEIDASGGRLDGRGQAVAGIVLGWVGIGLCALGIVAVIALIALAGTAEFSTY